MVMRYELDDIEQAAMGFNTESEAYRTGYEAHAQGERREANPYGKRSWNHEEWNRGWDTAEHSE